MISKSRRSFIRLAAGTVGATVATSMLPSSIQAALAIPAHRRHGNLKDVEHVVILMQENRSFDHYFGTLKGVRGFGDRMAIPLPDGQRVWHQKGSKGEILPYHFDTSTTSAQRVDGTPHTWPDAQQAWNEGRMDKWLPAKTERSLGYYKEQDIAFQFAMANAFTICDAYHCSFQGGTNPNRLFLWTGTNDPLGQHGGPVTTNDHDSNGPVEQGYTWTTYPERLQAAGITWRVYQDMADNFSDNPLIGFRQYRAAAPDSPLIVNGLSTWKLDALKRDVLANSLPQVSWIVAPAKYSEHPGPSSPIWGAEYTSWVLDALTANPEVWSKTALLVMFDENDGFFDHVAPPAAPSLNKDGTLRGKTTADATLEWHTKGDIRYRNQPYGLGPRVPMYVISPWSKGGWVNSQVFDHTSVIRFLEQRFGVMEPNISPWRRAVCGDLTSVFDFQGAGDTQVAPDLTNVPQSDARKEDAYWQQFYRPSPKYWSYEPKSLPGQEKGQRPTLAVPYQLHATLALDIAAGKLRLTLGNDGMSLPGNPQGHSAAVFQVQPREVGNPRFYTVTSYPVVQESGEELGRTLNDELDDLLDANGRYAFEVHGPNGFFREFHGNLHLAAQMARPEVSVTYQRNGNLQLNIRNLGRLPCSVTVTPNPAYTREGSRRYELEPNQAISEVWLLRSSQGWYDLSVTASNTEANYLRRLAGHVETGKPSRSDPLLDIAAT